MGCGGIGPFIWTPSRARGECGLDLRHYRLADGVPAFELVAVLLEASGQRANGADHLVGGFIDSLVIGGFG